MSRASRGTRIAKENSPFAVTLLKLMKQKPVTSQEELAEIVGKSRQTISQYVNGISEPGYDTLVKIADHFHVSLDYLLGRSEIPTPDLRVQEIHRMTGLSEENISRLLKKEEHAFGYSYADFVNMCLDGTYFGRANFYMLVEATVNKMKYEKTKINHNSDHPLSVGEYQDMINAMKAADEQAQALGCKLMSHDASIRFYAREIASDLEKHLLGVFEGVDNNGDD